MEEIMSLTSHSSFDLGDVPLLSGETLPNAQLAYKTYGRLNAAGDNVVVLPTFFTGTHRRNEGFFGPGRAIDPEHHFVVSINMFGNGLSTSPSHAARGEQGAWPSGVTLYDNVQCQHRLLFDHLGVQRIALVAGWSMAGCQAYHWAALYPDLVDAIIPFCASAKTSPHNFVFLEGVKAALLADPRWDGRGGASSTRGLKAFARVYAGWAYSQTFFRDGYYRELGYESIEDLLVDWENDHVQHWNAHDLLAKIWSWQRSDISANPLYESNFQSALRAISARAIVIPCTQDLYFPPEDNRLEVNEMPNAELRPYDSPFGHCVANPGNDTEFEKFLDAAIHDVLQPTN
ncbi:alpha/beta fold hydrolase [Mycolicibacterium mengxianglii]|uniref:alpha/beta fold hydrolase n=1 Tax=Mycolicibacterium mengxianglii TaxID=2736649 RepID=UPI001E4E1CEA|nr:alpha/beta fold hydrolase [Mycolicibacterium mengxianglii]